VVHFGRFTDGYRFAPPGWKGVLPSGMRFAPLYPGIVAAAAELDGGLRRGMDCVVDSAQQISVCPGDARSVRWLQFFELAGFLWLVWWMGGAVGGRAVGWVSLVLALGTAPLLLRSVNFLMTEMTCLLWVTSAMAAGIKALRGRKQAAWSACAGVLHTRLRAGGFVPGALGKREAGAGDVGKRGAGDGTLDLAQHCGDRPRGADLWI
jgi:hypothetical protein